MMGEAYRVKRSNAYSQKSFIANFEKVVEEHPDTVWTYKIGGRSKQTQKALAHIWLKQYYGFIKNIPERSVTPKNVEEMKLSAKSEFYRQTASTWILERITNVFRPDISKVAYKSMAEWDPSETFEFMQWMQGCAAQEGLVLESAGVYEKMVREQNGG